MGEMADFYLEQIFDVEERMMMDPCGYGEEYQEDWIPQSRRYTPPLKCEHCGTLKVSWKRMSGKWVLVDPNGIPHTCVAVLTPSEKKELIS